MSVPGDRAALFAETAAGGRVRCRLCPRECNIPVGKPGFCMVRRNVGGTLVLAAWGRPTALHVDPIEKKPLYHYLPGTTSLSLGTVGCSLACRFCQNWTLSRGREVEEGACGANGRSGRGAPLLPPERLVALAVRHGSPSISFTYNEPTILAEYVLDTAEVARPRGVGIVMVTNGYITREAARVLYPHVDAANVDLKAFSDEFYRKQCSGRLKPVLDALIEARAAGVHVEVTTLLIPGLNTDAKDLRAEAAWIRDHLGADTPLHFSAFHPDYRMTDRPRTPPEALRFARTVALEAGLKYVYEGNVQSDGSHTLCPSCGRWLIRRSWFEVTGDRLSPDGRCACGEPIAIVREPVRGSRVSRPPLPG